MEIPRLGVESELYPPAYTTATSTPNPSCVWDHHSSWQCQILNPLIETRDWTCILVHVHQIRFHWAMTGTLRILFLKWKNLADTRLSKWPESIPIMDLPTPLALDVWGHDNNIMSRVFMLHTKKKGSWAKTDQQTTQTEDMPQNHKPVLFKNVSDREFPLWLSGEPN